MRNIVLQDRCPLDLSEHAEIVASLVVARIVLNVLEPRRRQLVPCMAVLPLIGPAL